MNNKRATKRALLTSVMALVMCVVMLVGTTFAWFTDTASTGVNKIQAGNLDIEVEYRTTAGGDWKTLDDATDLFGAAGTLFEPGHTRVVELRITNAGNLALKYKIGMNVVSEQPGTNKAGNPYKLSNYLKVATTLIQSGPTGDSLTDQVAAKMESLIFQRDASYIWTARDFANFELEIAGNGNVHSLQPGEMQFLGMKVYMPESVGNEANAISTEKAASIEFGLNILATQYTTESDSFGTQYDKDAEYPTTADNAADLQAALAAGKDVMLTKSVALTAPLSISKDVTITGNGYAVISEYPVDVAPTAEVTFDGVNFAVPKNNNNNASSVYASRLEGKVVFDGCTFTNPQWECIQITPKDGAEIVVTNCTFIVDGTGTYAHGAKVERMLHIQNTEATGDYTVTITNNKFIGTDKVSNSVIDVDDIKAFGNVICGGNSFATADGTLVTTLADKWIYVNLNRKYDAASVATNTFAQFTQTSAAALHH